MIAYFVEVGSFSAAVEAEGHGKEANKRIWENAFRESDSNTMVHLLLNGETRWCPLRFVWICGFWSSFSEPRHD